jgi:hypothetical protein
LRQEGQLSGVNLPFNATGIPFIDEAGKGDNRPKQDIECKQKNSGP